MAERNATTTTSTTTVVKALFDIRVVVSWCPTVEMPDDLTKKERKQVLDIIYHHRPAFDLVQQDEWEFEECQDGELLGKSYDDGQVFGAPDAETPSFVVTRDASRRLVVKDSNGNTLE